MITNTESMINTLDIISNINSHLFDIESKCVFESRAMYAMTGDRHYLINLAMCNDASIAIMKQLLTNNKKVIFGAGSVGQSLLGFCKDYNIVAICDNNADYSEKKELEGLPFYSPAEAISTFPNSDYIITSTRFYHEIEIQLLESGVTKDRIINLGGTMSSMISSMYFDIPEMQEYIKECDYFIDGGAFDGSDTLKFLNLNSKGISYCFEPSDANMKKSRSLLYPYVGRVKYMNKIIWDSPTTLNFNDMNGAGSMVTDSEESSKVQIESICLDDCIKDFKGTHSAFLKLDVEGSEINALRGGRNIIRTKPLLAISVYHKKNDIFDLPEYILSIRDDYKFIIRHYGFANPETVLYGF